MIFFTADHHFGHANVIKYSKRPFADVQAMDTALIERWNAVVGEEDTVYHLGDFTLFGYGAFQNYASKLNGKIRIIPGGHDYRWLEDFYLHQRDIANVDVLWPLYSLELPEYGRDKYPLVIVLCHYSMQVWDRSHFGSYHLFGHSHGNQVGCGMSFDVGVDCWDFTPVKLDTVLARFSIMSKIAAS